MIRSRLALGALSGLGFPFRQIDAGHLRHQLCFVLLGADVEVQPNTQSGCVFLLTL